MEECFRFRKNWFLGDLGVSNVGRNTDIRILVFEEGEEGGLGKVLVFKELREWEVRYN